MAECKYGLQTRASCLSRLRLRTLYNVFGSNLWKSLPSELTTISIVLLFVVSVIAITRLWFRNNWSVINFLLIIIRIIKRARTATFVKPVRLECHVQISGTLHNPTANILRVFMFLTYTDTIISDTCRANRCFKQLSIVTLTVASWRMTVQPLSPPVLMNLYLILSTSLWYNVEHYYILLRCVHTHAALRVDALRCTMQLSVGGTSYICAALLRCQSLPSVYSQLNFTEIIFPCCSALVFFY